MNDNVIVSANIRSQHFGRAHRRNHKNGAHLLVKLKRRARRRVNDKAVVNLMRQDFLTDNVCQQNLSKDIAIAWQQKRLDKFGRQVRKGGIRRSKDGRVL